MWRSLCVPLLPGVRALSCGPARQAGSLWRLQHGMSRSGTEYGPLTDLPDWSFAVILYTPGSNSPTAEVGASSRGSALQPDIRKGGRDGRPAPPMKGQERRRQKAAEMAGRIVMLTNELQRGMERWAGQQAALCRQREEQQESRLRPKGARTRPRAPPGGHPSQ